MKLKGFLQFINESTDLAAEGRNNPVWIALVAKLKGLSYPPKVLTFTSYDGIPSQSLNWGMAKGPNGNYGLAMGSTDSETPKEMMSLFNQDDLAAQATMHKWWKSKGYETNGDDVSIKFKEADRLFRDLEEFFTKYPPSKR